MSWPPSVYKLVPIVRSSDPGGFIDIMEFDRSITQKKNLCKGQISIFGKKLQLKVVVDFGGPFVTMNLCLILQSGCHHRMGYSNVTGTVGRFQEYKGWRQGSMRD